MHTVASPSAKVEWSLMPRCEHGAQPVPEPDHQYYNLSRKFSFAHCCVHNVSTDESYMTLWSPRERAWKFPPQRATSIGSEPTVTNSPPLRHLPLTGVQIKMTMSPVGATVI
jgi:hypothetical protein